MTTSNPPTEPVVTQLRERIEYATGQIHDATEWDNEPAPDGPGTMLDWVCRSTLLPATIDVEASLERGQTFSAESGGGLAGEAHRAGLFMAQAGSNRGSKADILLRCATRITALEAAVARKDAALIFARDTFRWYADLHRGKGTLDGDEKATRNAEFATRMSAALSTRLSDMGGYRRGIEDAWQSMDTAPTDGTPVLLFARAKTATASAPVIGWYSNHLGEWIEACFVPNNPVGIVPSAWMLRPEFPRG